MEAPTTIVDLHAGRHQAARQCWLPTSKEEDCAFKPSFRADNEAQFAQWRKRKEESWGFEAPASNPTLSEGVSGEVKSEAEEYVFDLPTPAISWGGVDCQVEKLSGGPTTFFYNPDPVVTCHQARNSLSVPTRLLRALSRVMLRNHPELQAYQINTRFRPPIMTKVVEWLRGEGELLKWLEGNDVEEWVELASAAHLLEIPLLQSTSLSWVHNYLIDNGFFPTPPMMTAIWHMTTPTDPVRKIALASFYIRWILLARHSAPLLTWRDLKTPDFRREVKEVRSTTDDWVSDLQNLIISNLGLPIAKNPTIQYPETQCLRIQFQKIMKGHPLQMWLYTIREMASEGQIKNQQIATFARFAVTDERLIQASRAHLVRSGYIREVGPTELRRPRASFSAYTRTIADQLKTNRVANKHAKKEENKVLSTSSGSKDPKSNLTTSSPETTKPEGQNKAGGDRPCQMFPNNSEADESVTAQPLSHASVSLEPPNSSPRTDGPMTIEKLVNKCSVKKLSPSHSNKRKATPHEILSNHEAEIEEIASSKKLFRGDFFNAPELRKLPQPPEKAMLSTPAGISRRKPMPRKRASQQYQGQRAAEQARRIEEERQHVRQMELPGDCSWIAVDRDLELRTGYLRSNQYVHIKVLEGSSHRMNRDLFVHRSPHIAKLVQRNSNIREVTMPIQRADFLKLANRFNSARGLRPSEWSIVERVGYVAAAEYFEAAELVTEFIVWLKKYHAVERMDREFVFATYRSKIKLPKLRFFVSRCFYWRLQTTRKNETGDRSEACTDWDGKVVADLMQDMSGDGDDYAYNQVEWI